MYERDRADDPNDDRSDYQNDLLAVQLAFLNGRDLVNGNRLMLTIDGIGFVGT
jgi:hypothetical protein